MCTWHRNMEDRKSVEKVLQIASLQQLLDKFVEEKVGVMGCQPMSI